MQRSLPLVVVLSAVLSACGSVAQPPTPPSVAGVLDSSAARITGLDTLVTAAVIDTQSGQGRALLHLTGAPGLGSQPLTFSVVSAPAGLTVLPGVPALGISSADVVLEMKASAPVQSGSLLLKVALGGQTQTVRVPVLNAAATELPSVGGSRFQPVSSTTCPGGDVYLSAPVNAALEQRTQVLRLNTAGTFQSYDLNLALTEGVTSQLCTPTGDLWLTIRSDAAQGSVIAHLHNDSGTLERFGVGATADTINNLTRTPDGRLWFVQYKRDRLGEFDPVSGAVTTHSVTDNAENLTLGQDGSLYFSRFYTAPAVVRYDPASGTSTALSVGAANRNLPRAVVQTQGAVWYIDAWTQQLLRIDPVSGVLESVALPAGAAPTDLLAAPDGTLWVSDAAAHVLYRLAPGSTEAVRVPLLGAASDGPRALSVSASGELWYESGGRLIGLK